MVKSSERMVDLCATGPGDMKDNTLHGVLQMSLQPKLRDDGTPEISNMPIWSFDRFSQLSCHVLILYAKPISQNTVRISARQVKN